MQVQAARPYSPRYVSMIYVFEAILWNNYNALFFDEVTDLESFKKENWKLLEQIVADMREAFQYEPSSSQCDAAIGWFLNVYKEMTGNKDIKI